jgi:hypothetical protein
MRRVWKEFWKEKNVNSEVMPETPGSIPPESFESVRCQGGVSGRVLVAMPQVGLQRPGIVAIVRQLVAARVPKHVGVGFNTQISRRSRAFDHPREALCR